VIALAVDESWAANPRHCAHHSEQVFAAALMPVVNPATLQDYLDLGILGFALVALCQLLGSASEAIS